MCLIPMHKYSSVHSLKIEEPSPPFATIPVPEHIQLTTFPGRGRALSQPNLHLIVDQADGPQPAVRMRHAVESLYDIPRTLRRCETGDTTTTLTFLPTKASTLPPGVRRQPTAVVAHDPYSLYDVPRKRTIHPGNRMQLMLLFIYS